MGGLHFYKTKTDHTDWIAELHVLYSTVAKSNDNFNVSVDLERS